MADVPKSSEFIKDSSDVIDHNIGLIYFFPVILTHNLLNIQNLLRCLGEKAF